MGKLSRGDAEPTPGGQWNIPSLCPCIVQVSYPFRSSMSRKCPSVYLDTTSTKAEVPDMAPVTDARHPIGVVSERTGLTADVLRVWERRYGVVEPKRSAGGQRIYSDADIERLSLLHRATRGGHGISPVAPLSKARLEDIVRDVELSATTPPIVFIPAGEPDLLVDQVIAFTEALDPAGLES